MTYFISCEILQISLFLNLDFQPLFAVALLTLVVYSVTMHICARTLLPHLSEFIWILQKRNKMNIIAIRTRPCVLAWSTVVIQNRLGIIIYVLRPKTYSTISK